MIKAAALLSAMIALTAAGPDRRAEMFASETASIPDAVMLAEASVACGLRDRATATRVEMRVTKAAMDIADELWPNAARDIPEGAARGVPVKALMDRMLDAIKTGKAATPKQCPSVVSALPTLDDLAAGK